MSNYLHDSKGRTTNCIFTLLIRRVVLKTELNLSYVDCNTKFLQFLSYLPPFSLTFLRKASGQKDILIKSEKYLTKVRGKNGRTI